MVDAVSVVHAICALAVRIKTTVDEMTSNRKEAIALRDRVDAIVAALQPLAADEIESLTRVLQRIKDCLDHALTFLDKFKSLSSFKLALKSNKYLTRFAELNQTLSECESGLNTALNAYAYARMKSLKLHVQNDRRSPSSSSSLTSSSSPRLVTIPFHDLEFIRRLGSGGFGDVWYGKWLSRRQPVAIKQLRCVAANSSQHDDFVKEVTLMTELGKHDNVVSLLGACLEHGKYCMVMEFMELGSLYTLLHDSIPLSWPVRWSLAYQCTLAIHHIHQLDPPITHRDFKSHNVLVERHATKQFLCKICDFGLSKIKDSSIATTKGTGPSGTLQWTAPEIMELNPFTHKADIYSLGIVFWEIATRQDPYGGFSEAVIRSAVRDGMRLPIPSTVPIAFSAMIQGCWNSDPAQRLTTSMLLDRIEAEVTPNPSSSTIPAAAMLPAATNTSASPQQTVSDIPKAVFPSDNVDLIIAKLLEVRGQRPGKQVSLLESDIIALCHQAKYIFLNQSTLLELEAPIKIIGDIHGQYYDLLRIFEYCGFPPDANYLFLGNYVDYGKQSLETICLLLAYKCKYPENFFLLRGNHECASINRSHGFYDECKRRYSVKLWKTFTDCFNCLPFVAVIDEKIFCTHGGLSPELHSMEQIRRIQRPVDVPDHGLICDLLWSEPDTDIDGWAERSGENHRLGFCFGQDVVEKFLKKHDFDLVCRAGQVVEYGYQFYYKRRLVSLFSAPNYLGEFDNAAAMMSLDESLTCSFQILKPAEKKFSPKADNDSEPTA